MISQDSVKSALKLDNIFFEKIQMSATGNSDTTEANAEVAFKIETPLIENDTLVIKLFCNVAVKEVMKLELCLVGVFKSENAEFLKKMIPNAVAIIFPYMRSQVSLMTAQPNIPTLVLPSININALLESSKKE